MMRHVTQYFQRYFGKNIGMSWFEACNEINIATCIFKRFSGFLYDKLFNIVVGKSYVAK